MAALLADLRCIDAHVHLGNQMFDQMPEDAIRHYEIALGIGELSLKPDFKDTLPWGYLFNRPFLRALHGYGLCLWRLGQDEKALQVFERMLALNPRDNQGVRLCWSDIRNGRSWEPDR
jgi:tetratricopeptide (TPR) repeat protein